MKCPNCKKKMEDRTEEWSENGEKVWYCEDCDEAHSMRENICPKCGHKWGKLE